MRTEKSAALAQLRSARALARPAAALPVLDDALARALAAAHLGRCANEPFDVERELAWLDANVSLRVPAVETARARAAVDREDFAAMETARDRMDALVGSVAEQVEARTPLELVALRWGRAAAVLIAVVWVGGRYARSHWMVHDVALHKPVKTSPLRVTPPTPDAIVDGRTRGTFGVHTADGHPFVTIDLERSYALRDVRVYNRGDGWFDDVLPLTLSISEDGRHFDTVATRTTHFDVWDVALHQRNARYVRVSKESGYIALNEIEVYAKD